MMNTENVIDLQLVENECESRIDGFLSDSKLQPLLENQTLRRQEDILIFLFS